MAKSDAQRRAENKYSKAHLCVVGCKMRKTDAEAFKQACKDAGTNPNAVFTAAWKVFMKEHEGDRQS